MVLSTSQPKEDTARKGIGIEFNSNYVFEKVLTRWTCKTNMATVIWQSIPVIIRSPRVGTKPATQDEAFNRESAWGSKLDGAL